VKCSDVCKCLFKIGEHEFGLYRMLVTKPCRVEELAEKLGKDRSTVQRCLNKLLSCGMIKREQVVIKEGGGRYYIYRNVPPDELIPWLNACLEEWYREMKKAVNDFRDF